MNDNKYFSVNISCCGALTIVFVVLKLVGVINWSWLRVLAPTWIPLLLVALIILVVFIACWCDTYHDTMNIGFKRKGHNDKWKF